MEFRLRAPDKYLTTPETVGKLLTGFGLLSAIVLYVTVRQDISLNQGVWMTDFAIVVGVPIAYAYTGYQIANSDFSPQECKAIVQRAFTGFVTMFIIANWIIISEALEGSFLNRPVFITFTVTSIGALIGVYSGYPPEIPEQADSPQLQTSMENTPQNTGTVSEPQFSTDPKHSGKTLEEHMNELDEVSRRIIHLLEDEPNNTMVFDELVEELTTVQNQGDTSPEKHRKSLAAVVRHSKLPKLNSRGLITQTPDGNTITYRSPEN